MSEFRNNLLELIKKAAEEKKNEKPKEKPEFFKFDTEKARAFLEKHKKK